MWEQYQEAPAWTGKMKDGSEIGLYLSLSGTWTLVQTDLLGVSCAVTNGLDWSIPLNSWQPQSDPGLET